MRKVLLFPFIMLLLLLVSCHHNKSERSKKPTEEQLCRNAIEEYPVTVTGIRDAEEYCLDVEFNDKNLELKRNEYLLVRDIYNAGNSMGKLLGLGGSNQFAPGAFNTEADLPTTGIKGNLSGIMGEVFQNIDDAFKRIQFISSFPASSVTIDVGSVNIVWKGDMLRKLFSSLDTSTVVISLKGRWGMPELRLAGFLFSALYGLWEVLASQDLGTLGDWGNIIGDYNNRMVGESYVGLIPPWPHFIAHILGNYRDLLTWDKNGREYYRKSRIFFEGMLANLFGSEKAVTYPSGTTEIAAAGEGLIEMLNSRLVKSGQNPPWYIYVIDSDGNGKLSRGDLIAINGIKSAYKNAGSSDEGFIINPFSEEVLAELKSEGKKILSQLENFTSSQPDFDLGKVFSDVLNSIGRETGYTGDQLNFSFPDGFVLADFGALYRVVDNYDFTGLRSLLPAWIYNGGVTRTTGFYRMDVDVNDKPFDYIMLWEFEYCIGNSCWGSVNGKEFENTPPLLILDNLFDDPGHFTLFLSGTGQLNSAFVYNVLYPTDAFTDNLVILPPDNLLPETSDDSELYYFYFDWQEPTLWGFLEIDETKFPDNCRPAMDSSYDEVTLDQIKINGIVNCAMRNEYDLILYIWNHIDRLIR